LVHEELLDQLVAAVMKVLQDMLYQHHQVYHRAAENN
jgi:hypothetical protein